MPILSAKSFSIAVIFESFDLKIFLDPLFKILTKSPSVLQIIFFLQFFLQLIMHFLNQ